MNTLASYGSSSSSSSSSQEDPVDATRCTSPPRSPESPVLKRIKPNSADDTSDSPPSQMNTSSPLDKKKPPPPHLPKPFLPRPDFNGPSSSAASSSFQARIRNNALSSRIAENIGSRTKSKIQQPTKVSGNALIPSQVSGRPNQSTEDLYAYGIRTTSKKSKAVSKGKS